MRIESARLEASPSPTFLDRVFHLSDRDDGDTAGNAHKFWRGRLDGPVQTVRFERIGTVGQTCTKTFSPAAEAATATQRLIAQKMNKGYREVTLEQATQVPPRRKQQQQQRRLPKRQRQQLALPF